MARQLVTSVCVVCVLCALHSHCAVHHGTAANGTTSWHGLSPNAESNLHRQATRHKPPRSTTTTPLDSTSESSLHRQEARHKPQVTTPSREEADLEQRAFIKRILDKFGDGESISYDGFREMLKSKRSVEVLGEVLVDSDVETVVGVKTAVNTTRSHAEGEPCVHPSSMFAAQSDASGRVRDTELRAMCPSLLYVMTMSDDKCDPPAAPAKLEAGNEGQISQVQVWLYATLSIIVISLCGLLGVAVIPIMKHLFYQQLLQFFVALAVGTLCGDALLHLLPHAMMSSAGHSHGEDPSESHHHHDDHHDAHHADHDANMYRGLVAAGGVVFLFFTERCLALVSEWRQRRLRRRKAPPRVRVMRTTEQVVGDASVGEKLCKHKYSSYPYCYDEINTETVDDHHQKNSHYKTDNHTTAVVTTTEGAEMGGGDSSPRFPAHGDHHHDDATVKVAVEHSPERTVKITGPPESLTVILREHENVHHGHSHTHGHVHSAPGSMSSVAWMVIMGDGLHNFTDGMAIGAAFAANIAGGFSTAIAVFCHELPHELGDFAVLLKAGMSAKQAVFYNVLSSVLCFFGMVVGVNAGGWDSATQWIFAAAAGMFLYIALVDMVPELTSGHTNEGSSWCQFVLQVTGMLAGLGIMFTIAIYEEDLKTVFVDGQ